MIEYPKLTLCELVEECQNGDIVAYDRKGMIAALQNRDKTHPTQQPPPPQLPRISIHDPKNRWRKDYYHNCYEYQLKAECVERKLELGQSDGKVEFIDKLLRDDERLLREELNSMIINKDPDLENSIIRLLEFYCLQTRARLRSEEIIFDLCLSSDKRRFETGLDSEDEGWWGKRSDFDIRQNNRRAEFQARQEAIKLEEYNEAITRCKQIRNEAYATGALRVAQETTQREQLSIPTVGYAKKPSGTPTATPEIEQPLQMELQESSFEESTTIATANDEASSVDNVHDTTQEPSQFASSHESIDASDTQQKDARHENLASKVFQTLNGEKLNCDVHLDSDRNLSHEDNPSPEAICSNNGNLRDYSLARDEEENGGSGDVLSTIVVEVAEPKDQDGTGSGALRVDSLTFSDDESHSVANESDFSGNDPDFIDDEHINGDDLASDDDDAYDDLPGNEIEDLAPYLKAPPKHSPPMTDGPRTVINRRQASRDHPQVEKRKGDNLASKQAKKLRTARLSPDSTRSANSSPLTSTTIADEPSLPPSPNSLIATSSGTPHSPQNVAPSRNTYSGPVTWNGAPIRQNVKSEAIEEELDNTPRVIIRRLKLGTDTIAKPQKPKLMKLWTEQIHMFANKRCILVDKIGVIHISFHDTAEGEREARTFFGMRKISFYRYWVDHKKFDVRLEWYPTTKATPTTNNLASV